VLHSGRTIRDLAKSIGVHEITLGKWVNKAKGGDSRQDKDLSETERAMSINREHSSHAQCLADFAVSVTVGLVPGHVLAAREQIRKQQGYPSFV
jgi:transposase